MRTCREEESLQSTLIRRAAAAVAYHSCATTTASISASCNMKEKGPPAQLNPSAKQSSTLMFTRRGTRTRSWLDHLEHGACDFVFQVLLAVGFGPLATMILHLSAVNAINLVIYCPPKLLEKSNYEKARRAAIESVKVN